MDVTDRFSDRVEDYAKTRPGYPDEVLSSLAEHTGYGPSCVVADIGSGTGIWTEKLLRFGNVVFAVEPNEKMRAAAEQRMSSFPGFHSMKGRAEGTGIASGSIDFVFAAQAFHWFDQVGTRTELFRILKPHGWVVLLWNDRKLSSPFATAYEHLIQTHNIDLNQIDHRNIDHAVLSAFFSPNQYQEQQFEHQQLLDREGLQGRVLSCSYMPSIHHPGYQPMIDDLNRLFQEFNQQGIVTFDYVTRMIYGRLS